MSVTLLSNLNASSTKIFIVFEKKHKKKIDDANYILIIKMHMKTFQNQRNNCVMECMQSSFDRFFFFIVTNKQYMYINDHVTTYNAYGNIRMSVSP
jgi:hypothetical protein